MAALIKIIHLFHGIILAHEKAMCKHFNYSQNIFIVWILCVILMLGGVFCGVMSDIIWLFFENVLKSFDLDGKYANIC